MATSFGITDGEAARVARVAAEDVLIGYADALDRGDFEAWAEMFSDHGSYRLAPRINAERGLPIALMSCASKAWAQDRAAAILHASLYSPHCYRHFYANLAVRPLEAGRVRARCNYAVYRTVSDG
ncbi:MAG: nuclear transport factor 2 family protein, partial [Actinomycetota bacterium]|nr:nuclear transport factor 2 family protein [Actinomycetota bacterium]